MQIWWWENSPKHTHTLTHETITHETFSGSKVAGSLIANLDIQHSYGHYLYTYLTQS